MTGRDPLAAWRANPFFVLAVAPAASRQDIERAGQRLLGLLAVGSAAAGRYETPLGPATRDADQVRAALAALRDPDERVAHELLADLARGADKWIEAWTWVDAARAIGLAPSCPE